MGRKKGSKTAMPAQTVGAAKSIRLEFGLDLHRELRIAAAKEDMSMAALVRQIVEQYLKEEIAKRTRAEKPAPHPKKKGAGR